MRFSNLKYLIKLLYNTLLKISGNYLNFPSLSSMTLDADDVSLADKILQTPNDWYNTKYVENFANEFSVWNGSKYAWSFMGGRAALSAAIFGLNLKEGDEIIIPGYTCVVVPNAFLYEKINIVHCDIELDTFGVDFNSLTQKVSEKTKAIIIHHLYGLVCRDYNKIISFAKEKGIKIIEDCAHAAGATYKGIKVGNFGDVAFYSFEQSKMMNTVKGGVVVTNEDSIASRINEYYNTVSNPDKIFIKNLLRNFKYNYYKCKHPQKWFFAPLYGFLYSHRLIISTTSDEIQNIKPLYYGQKMPGAIALLASNQLKKLDSYIKKRQEHAEIWNKWCAENACSAPVIIPDSNPVFLRYPVIVEEEKKKDTRWTRSLNIQAGVWFTGTWHPVDGPVTDCPNSYIAVKQCINFPTLGII